MIVVDTSAVVAALGGRARPGTRPVSTSRPSTRDLAYVALDAWMLFGKSRHPAHSPSGLLRLRPCHHSETLNSDEFQYIADDERGLDTVASELNAAW
jgi:hypothetical protein